MNEPNADGGRTDPRHYSYAHYASREVAEHFDAVRFGGPIGQYLADVQQDIFLEALAPAAGRIVLDVGTGTGRAALTLATAGAHVTGVDASREMLEVARIAASDRHVAVTFEVADAHRLPFADQSVDAAVCLRLLMHVPDWRQCVSELCRVARWRVILDFPARASFAALESAARKRTAAAGRQTEPYRVLAEQDVRAALLAGGFKVTRVHRQFVLPIAFHKKVGSLALTRATERVLAGIGLRRLLGSPVTMVAER